MRHLNPLLDRMCTWRQWQEEDADHSLYHCEKFEETREAWWPEGVPDFPKFPARLRSIAIPPGVLLRLGRPTMRVEGLPFERCPALGPGAEEVLGEGGATLKGT
eukprot:1561156-Alexandrium_andersonii.AAC.1